MMRAINNDMPYVHATVSTYAGNVVNAAHLHINGMPLAPKILDCIFIVMIISFLCALTTLDAD